MPGRSLLSGVALVIAAGTIGDVSAADDLSLEYRARLLGIPLASASAQLEVSGDHYRLSGRFRTNSLVSLFAPWTQEAISAGRLDSAGATAAERHWQNGVYKAEARHIDVRYGAERATITSAAPDPDDRRPERRVPPDLTGGTMDIMSGLLTVAQQVGNGEGCAAKLPIFDGRRLYDVTVHDVGPENDTADGDKHAEDTVECRFVVTQLAGFSKDRGLATDPDEPGRIWFRQTSLGMPAIPVRLELGTNWGSAVVELVDMSPATGSVAEG